MNYCIPRLVNSRALGNRLHIAYGTRLGLVRCGAILLLAAAGGFSQTAKQDMKSAGRDVKQAGKNTGRATKATAGKAKNKSRKVVNKSAGALEKGSAKVERKTRH